MTKGHGARGRVLLAAAAVLAFPACNVLLGHDPAIVDPGGTDGGAEGGGGFDAGESPAHDGAPAEAAVEEIPDVPCAQPWTRITETGSSCARRTVVRLQEYVLDGSTISLALAGGDRVAVAYNSKASLDEGLLRVLVFKGSTVGTTAFNPQAVVVAGTQFEDIGPAAHIAGSLASPQFHLLYQMLPDGELTYRRIGANNALTNAELVATNVTGRTYVDLALAPTGDARALWFVPGQAGTPGRLVTRLRTEATGTLGAPQDVAAGFVSDGASGNGQHALVVDDQGAMHLAFHQAQTSLFSAPRYVQSSGAGFTSTKSLDNTELDGMSGFSVAFALVGDVRYAAYFSRKAGRTTADLRLASWVARADAPRIEVLEQGIDAPDLENPRYRVAMTVGPHGLLHLAVISPTTGGHGLLEYLRQTRRNGRLEWVSDVVDNDAFTPQAGLPNVTIAVEPGGRAHIAYYVPPDGHVMYATRTP